MPNTGIAGGFDFSDAPGGDQTLDDIFSFEGTSEGTPTTNETQGTTESTEAQPFLKTATGTVYNSADDAVKGIEHKDALIAELRQQVAQNTGNDPLKNRPTEPDSYIANPKRYFEDMRKAKSEEELLQVQQRFVDEKLAPFAPLIAGVAKNQAIEQTAAEIPEITTFLRSPEYQKTLDAYPLLKQSILVSENNPQVSGDLGQLYKMAYMASSGMNVSKIVREGATRQSTTETRPTVSSTLTTPPQNNGVVAKPSMTTPQGRQSIIEQQKSAGVEDIRF